MTRILKIETCDQCPHDCEMLCIHPEINRDKNLIYNYPDIPEWCPLEVEE